MNSLADKLIFQDFEYRAKEIIPKLIRTQEDPNQLVLVSMIPYAGKHAPRPQAVSLDLRTPAKRRIALEGIEELIKTGHIFVSFNASAELSAMYVLGVDLTRVKIIDLMVEAKMIGLTYKKYNCNKPNLLNILKIFGINHTESSEHKNEMRNLILNKTEYSDKEWRDIIDYCESDIIDLQSLLEAIALVHVEIRNNPNLSKNVQITFNSLLREMINRGDYLIACELNDRKVKGYPVNTDRLEAIFTHKNDILTQLYKGFNTKSGFPVFVQEQTTKGLGKWKYWYTGFERLLAANKIAWKLTAKTNRPCLSEKYVAQRAKENSLIYDFYQVFKTRRAFNSTDLRDLVYYPEPQRAYIRAVQQHFTQKTSRSSPKPAQGFILNLMPWIRAALIHPHKDEVFIGFDWRSQEIGIAAQLSNDDNMLADYKSGDPYIAFLVRTYIIPETDHKMPMKDLKVKYALERKFAKTVVLGLLYGKGKKALALDFFELFKNDQGKPTKTMDECTTLSDRYLENHKTAYRKYWNYTTGVKTASRNKKYFKTRDNWIYFVIHHDDVYDTQLQNLPCQSEAAHMLRQAMIRLKEKGFFKVVCSLHDAIYILTDSKSKERDCQLVEECMLQACVDVLSEPLIGTDRKEFTEDSPFWDERAQEQYKIIHGFLGSVMDHPNLN